MARKPAVVGPVHKARIGLLQMAVWENERDMDNGEKRTFRSVTLKRSYRNGEGEWRETSQLNIEDLGGAIKLLDNALEFVMTPGD